MKFFAKGPWVYMGEPAEASKDPKDLLGAVKVALVLDGIENQNQVADRIAQILTKHWIED